MFFYTQAARDHDVFSISQLNAAPNKLISALLRVWISCNMQLVMRSAYKPAVANKREALRTSCEEIKKLILAKLCSLEQTVNLTQYLNLITTLLTINEQQIRSLLR